MKALKFYKAEIGSMNENSVFKYFLETLQSSIVTWDYFVDWEKVKRYINTVNVELNILNSLIGRKHIKKEFVELCSKYPEVKRVLPILIAVRKAKLDSLPVITDKRGLNHEIKSDIFFQTDRCDETELMIFFEKSGLQNMLEDKTVKNLIDYCIGVEVGMDTNARKNRTGFIMENICGELLGDFCNNNEYEILTEVTTQDIFDEWGIKMDEDEDHKKYDFAIMNKNKEVILVEVNYYTTGGSKPSEITRSYQRVSSKLTNQGFKFVWITDGIGWTKMKGPLREAFDNNDYVFNLQMIKDGILKEVL